MIRMRLLCEEEVTERESRGGAMLRVYCPVTGERYAILEQTYGENSAEGESWQAVEEY